MQVIINGKRFKEQIEQIIRLVGDKRFTHLQLDSRYVVYVASKKVYITIGRNTVEDIVTYNKLTHSLVLNFEYSVDVNTFLDEIIRMIEKREIYVNGVKYRRVD